MKLLLLRGLKLETGLNLLNPLSVRASSLQRGRAGHRVLCGEYLGLNKITVADKHCIIKEVEKAKQCRHGLGFVLPPPEA
jgi:hypothetical protein